MTQENRPPLGIGIVGTGQRCMTFFAPHIISHPAVARLVGLAEHNAARLESARGDLGITVRGYTSIDALIENPDIDTVIITTPDFTHREMLDKALAARKNVLCEKPLAATTEDALHMTRRAVAAPQVVQVGFMLRYAPLCMEIKRIIASGIIGSLVHVTAAEVVEFYHGASFFRRWHRFRQNSGGLLVHKACHTLDVVNWWIDSAPVTVAAQGGLATFVPNSQPVSRCRDCALAGICEASFDKKRVNYIYQTRDERAGNAETNADLCVFNSEKDTVDNAALTARYANGVGLSYAFTTTGSRHDRLFLLVGQRGHIKASQADGMISIEPAGSKAHTIVLPKHLRGDHGGGDAPLLEDFVSCIRQGRRPLADVKRGLCSIALAAGATESIDLGGQPVDLQGILCGF